MNAPTFDYTNRLFKLNVAFTAPATIPGDHTFNALLQGEVNPNGQGGVQINFLTHDFAFKFHPTSPTNVLQLHINDVAINPDQTNYGSGFIQVATGLPVPAPTAGMGALPLLTLLGVLGWRWRREREFACPSYVQMAIVSAMQAIAINANAPHHGSSVIGSAAGSRRCSPHRAATAE